MNAVSALAPLVVALTLAAGAPGTARAEPGTLDGKQFQGVFLERGKTSGDADTLTFRDGRFRSSACDRYGYSDAPYKSVAQGDATAFEAETESAKYGKMVWKGVIRDGKLDATVMWLRQGKPPVENWVVAGSKP